MRTRTRFSAALIVFSFVMCGQVVKKSPNPKLVDHLEVDENGAVHVFHTDGTEFKAPKEKGQESSESAQVGEGGHAAGWLATFQVCCQNYATPGTLIIYRPGKPLQRLGNGMLIEDWVFCADSKQVAFYTNTPHGNLNPRYELHDIETGRLLEKWVGPPTEKSPGWVNWLKSDQ